MMHERLEHSKHLCLAWLHHTLGARTFEVSVHSATTEAQLQHTWSTACSLLKSLI